MMDKSNIGNEGKKRWVLLSLSIFISIGTAFFFFGQKEKIKEGTLGLNESLPVGEQVSQDSIRSGGSEVDTLVMHKVAKRMDKLNLLEVFFNNSPIPALIKEYDPDKQACKILFFNKSFERIFLIPNGIDPKTYPGTYDTDYWPKEFAKSYVMQDLQVLMISPTDSVQYLDFDEQFMSGESVTHGRFIKYGYEGKYLFLKYLGREDKIQ